MAHDHDDVGGLDLAHERVAGLPPLGGGANHGVDGRGELVLGPVGGFIDLSPLHAAHHEDVDVAG